MTDPLAEFRAATGGGSGCRIPGARQTMTAQHRDAFDQAMTDRTISAPAIVKVLERWGINVTLHAVGAHRRGQCACSK